MKNESLHEEEKSEEKSSTFIDATFEGVKTKNQNSKVNPIQPRKTIKA